jgi:hypothetical protein
MLAFWAVFLGLYFAYKYFPHPLLALFCATTESNFQHFKATFFSFLIVNAVEYAVYRRQIADRQDHWYSRLTATVFAPWVVFLLWYIAPALYGKMPNIPLEIIYANIITLLVGLFVAILEQGFRQIRYTPGLKFVILALFVVSIGLYLIFTYNLPWADVFVEPDWR